MSITIERRPGVPRHAGWVALACWLLPAAAHAGAALLGGVADPARQGPAPAYESPFPPRPAAPPTVPSWRAVNDEVGRFGGHGAALAAPATGAPAAGAPADPHHGHGGMRK